MSLPEEPPRLLDDPGENLGELKLGLERMSSNVPNAEQLARMAERLGVAANGPEVDGRPPISKTLLKIGATTGVSAAILWAFLRGAGPQPAAAPTGSDSPVEATSPLQSSAPRAPGEALEPARRERPARETAVDEPSTSPERLAPSPAAAAVVAPVTSPAVPVAAPEAAGAKAASPVERTELESTRAAPSKAPRSSPGAGTGVSPAPARPPSASPPGEMELLRDARLAMSTDPGRALALTEQHRREHPNGGFSHEREVIAITALARLGRTSEARSRAERFRNAYPTSPYLERVERAVSP